MIQIILESFNSLFKGIDIFLQSKDLTVGAILALVAPFVVVWMKISNEKGKKAKQLLIERRQMQIAFNINEIMEHMGVNTKWNLQEIESTHTVLPSLKKFVLLSQAVTILRRRKLMNKLKSRKFWMAIFAVVLPVINEQFNIGLDNSTVIAAIGGLVAFILGEAHVDAKKAAETKPPAEPEDQNYSH